MTIAVQIANCNAPASDGRDRLVRISVLHSGYQGAPDPLPTDLGPGNSTTAYVHSGASLLIEERDPDKGGDDPAEAAED